MEWDIHWYKKQPAEKPLNKGNKHVSISDNREVSVGKAFLEWNWLCYVYLVCNGF